MPESNIYTKLRKFREGCPTLAFDKTVSAGRRSYQYVTLPRLLEIVTPVLSANHLVLTQAVTGLGVVTDLVDEDSPHVRLDSLVPINSDGLNSQELGSAITYARRYGIITLLGLAPDEDDDGAAASGKRSEPVPTLAVQINGEPEDEPEPVMDGWKDGKESAAAHTALSDRIGQLDQGQRSICSQWREGNGGWPLPKAKLEELEGIVALMETGAEPVKEDKF